MNVLKSLSLLLILAISTATSSFAFETDQYNLPPVSLADIGDEVAEYVEQRLVEAAGKLNAEIDKIAKCLADNQKGCDPVEKARKRLDQLRSDRAIADAVFSAIGDGNLFTTKFGDWLRKHKFRGQPDRFITPRSESIFLLNPLDRWTMSATVRLYEAEFGIDKLEHFFQQGHKYYEIRSTETDKGRNEQDAATKAIGWGQRSERTYFGLWASGVYSNADLYANYAGMKFYVGLMKPMQINGKTRPATFGLVDGKWRLVAKREDILRPFMTDHLNEAYNPSSFRLTLAPSVRRAVRKYACGDWHKTYPSLSREEITVRSAQLERWNSEDYGYTRRSRTVTIGDECFDKTGLRTD